MRLISKIVVVIMASVLASCGGPTVLVETPVPEGGDTSVVIPAPEGRMPVPLMEHDWTPGMIGGEVGAQLTQALADRASVMLMLGRGLSADMEEQAFQMVKAASERTAVVARSRATLDKLMQERGEIPYRVSVQPGGTDVFGRPFYLPKEHMLNTEWLSKKKAMKGAEALLTIRRTSVDDQRLKELRKRRRGGCDTLMAELNGALTEAKGFFEPMRRRADEELERAFARQMGEAVPFWKDEIEQAKTMVDPAGDEAKCLSAYGELVGEFEACVDKTCDSSPRLSVGAEGALIAMSDEPFSTLPDRCAKIAKRDYAEEIDKAAARAVDEVMTAIQGEWPAELLRYAALARVVDGMEDVCVPRHRRVSKDDLVTARADLQAFGAKLAGLEPAAEWYAAGGMSREAGVGPTRVLARVRSRGEDPVAAAGELLEKLKRMDKCRKGDERLLQAALVDVGSSEVVFMGVFFEEQLICEGMAPGTP